MAKRRNRNLPHDSLKCGFAFGCVALFVGLSLSSGIQGPVVRAALEEKYVEVTSEVCGSLGMGNRTVRLMTGQYQALWQYFADFQARLNATTSPVEVTRLYREAFRELARYNLLPENLSASQAEGRLEIPSFPYPIFQSRLGSQVKDNDVLENYFSWVAGWADRKAYFFGPVVCAGSGLANACAVGIIVLGLLLTFLGYTGHSLTKFEENLLSAMMLVLGLGIILGLVLVGIGLVPDILVNAFGGPRFMNYVYLDSVEGAISSRGILGTHEIRGILTGRLVGFSGLLIRGIDTKFFIGRSMMVNVTNAD